MDSFVVKYDVNDLLKGKELKPDSPSSCVCERLGNIFSDVLNKPKMCEEPSQIDSFKENAQSNKENEMTNIYSELQTIRLRQTDVISKLDLLIDKVNSQIEPVNQQYVNSVSINDIALKRSGLCSHLPKQMDLALLTGAKKRKCSQLQKKNEHGTDQCQFIEENSDNESDKTLKHTKNNVKTELEEPIIQKLTESDIQENEPDILSESMDDYENQRSRDCNSHTSSRTTCSRDSTKNSNEPSN